MKIFYRLLLPFFVGLSFAANAQMTIGRDSLFGNEWIDYAKTYFRIPVSADGVYRLSSATLTAAGIPASVAGDRFQMFAMGREIPIYTTTNSTFGGSDYIEFHARKHRSDLDSLLFKSKNLMLNPEVSVYNDTLTYFLTWNTTGTNKRMAPQANLLTNLPTKEAWFWHTEKYAGTEESFKATIGSDVFLPEFGEAEGMSSAFTTFRSLPFTTKYKVDGQPGQAKIRWTGNYVPHFTSIKVNDDEVGRDTSYYLGLRTRTIDIEANKLGATVNLSLKGEASAQDNNAIGTASLRYARAFNFDNTTSFEFTIAASETVKYLEIDNFNAGSAAPILYDLTNNWRMTTTFEGGKVKVALPPSVSERNFILFAATAPTGPINIKPQIFTDLRTDGGDYILISSSRHINDASNNLKQYADYRASAVGGSYKTKIIDVDQLYQQFGYGIARHPLSIRNFTQYIKKNWANPRYIVFVGKGREYRVNKARLNIEATENRTFDVPTWGYPGSDVLLVAGRKSDEPLVPFGRIAITSTSELKTYLDKVKEYESIQQTAPQTLEKRDWFKNIMHLSGGGPAEIAAISANMEAFKNIIENGKFGGKVVTFGKSNLDPVQTAQNDQIFDRLNKGLSIVSFYGHSSTSILDFDINYPSKMLNKGKYPIFMALGCSAANIHQNFAGVSENFVFYSEKGMSAFMGTTGTSYLHSLNIVASDMYKNLSDSLYGETIGTMIKKTLSTYSATGDQGLRSVVQEFVLNGDPALRYNAGPGPDYVSDEKTVRFEPSVLNAQLDSFNVTVDLVNIGSVTKDSMNVLFRQQLPNGLIYDLKSVRIGTPQYRTPFSIRLPMPSKVSVNGLNRLHIRVDADNEIAELPSAGAESNNDIRSSTGELGIPFYILENNAKPVYPANFAVVGTTPVVLKASTSDALAKPQNYIIEIDTTENFNSSYKQRTLINQKGGVLKWSPNVAWRDSMVYYWRISIDSTAPTPGYAWQNSSFTYIKNQEGWGQSHYYQFLKNDFSTLRVNEDDRKFSYVTDVKTVELRYAYASISRTYLPIFLVNNENYTGRNWGYPSGGSGGVYVTVFDEPTGIALKRKTIYGDYGIPHPNGWDINSYVFNTEDASPVTGRKGLMDFLKIIPEKSYVMIFTVQQAPTDDYYPERWAADSTTLGSNIFKMLEAEGAKRVRELATTGSRPYAFAYQKGKGLIAENRGDKFLDGAPIYFTMNNAWNRGDMTTKPIGPVKEWKSLEINSFANRTAGSGDTLGFDVIGMTSADKGDTLIMQNVRSTTALTTINAQQYPFLKLRFNSKDSIQRTSPQLLSWRILYRGLPDLAVNPNVAFTFPKDTLAQGDKMSLTIGVENVSEIDADSVTVQWTLRDQSNSETSTSKKFAPLSKNANFTVPITLDSKAWAGRYNLEFTVNPRNIQPELYTFNNYLQKGFTVLKDKKKPLLDVYFDGTRVAPNAIVSSKPTITVTLLDDNTYLRLTDTSVLSLSLQYPNGLKKTIPFSDPNLRFTPATSVNQNKATIESKPTFTEDGTYQLTVKGKDMTGNVAGDVDYSIAFKVITKSSISNVLNYPNPFSTRTQFVYTLTGETPPQYFRIQIMTISGKVVREITQDELGILKIGTHKTDFAWDGHDEYGNQLANGVYLYRIIAKGKDGKAFEAYEGDSTNEFFKKGIGKLVILR